MDQETETNMDDTEVRFDLSKVLNEEELESFKKAAREANAPTLTDHFLNLTLRDKAA